MGFTLPNNSSTPAVSREKLKDIDRIGGAMKYLIDLDLKPLDIISKNHLKMQWF